MAIISSFVNVFVSGSVSSPSLRLSLYRPDFSEIIAFGREEKVIYNFSCSRFIRWLRISELSVYIYNRFFFRVTRVFMKRIINNCVVRRFGFFFMNENGFSTRINNGWNIFITDHGFTVKNNLITFNGKLLLLYLHQRSLRSRI